MTEKTDTEERRMTDVPSGIPGACGDDTGPIDTGLVEVDPKPVEVDTEPVRGKNAGQAEEAGAAADDLTRLRAMQERLAEAEAENRRLEEICRLARSERDAALRHEESLRQKDALRRYLAEKGLSGDTADIALRGLSAETIRLEDGGLAAESREMLDGLMEGPFCPLFRMGGQNGDGVLRGVPLDKPPMEIGSMSREEILSIRDGVERRRAMLDNPGVFGL